MSMQPETREELFLAALAGEGEAPAPLTRRERYLKKIVEKADGSGGAVSWNELEDKPFGEVSEEQLLIASTEIKYTDPTHASYELTAKKFEPSGKEAYEILQPISTTGTPIRVVFDGVDYVFSNGFELSGQVIEGIPTAYLGNRGLDTDYPAPELDNGQPFLIRVGYFQVIIWFAEGETHTISMYCEQEKIKPLDPKYLPDGYPYKEEVRVTIIPETSVTAVDNRVSGNWELEISRDGYTYEPYLLHNDTRYKSVNVIYDGVLYENVPVDYVDGLTNVGSGDGGIGNTAQLRETGSERDYPFAIAASSAWTQSWFEIDGAHTVEVYVTETAIHPLAPELGGVPTPTAEDEGKVLMSVNGVPTWVALTNVAQEGA